MIEKESVSYIEGTPIAVRMYDVDRYVPHYHDDCIELIFVLKGDIDVLSTYDRFHMVKNDFTVINKGDVHCMKGRGENLVLSLYLDLSGFEDRHEYVQYIYFLCESFNVNAMQERYNPEVRSLVTDIVLAAAEDEGRRDTAGMRKKADELMDILVDRYDLANYASGKEIPESQIQRYYRIVKIIDTRYGEKLEISDLAQQEFIGRNYISQFWKNLTNMNLTDYITSIRTERAERMMLTTDKNINEVALSCGFSDSKYIYKGFKKWYEKTPSQHKKEYERYQEEGTRIKEYGREDLLDRFGRLLVYANMDESRASFMEGSEAKKDWRRKYEAQVGKYAGSKIKQEMMDERQMESGLREIYLPLLSQAVVRMDGENVDMDMDFVDMVLKRIRRTAVLLCIEMYFPERTPEEWVRVIEYFVHAAGDSGTPVLSKCRFIFTFDEFSDAAEVRALINRIAPVTGPKNTKMVLRFG